MLLDLSVRHLSAQAGKLGVDSEEAVSVGRMAWCWGPSCLSRQVAELGDSEFLDKLVDARSSEAANLGAFIDIPLAFSQSSGEVFAAGRGHGAAV